DVAVGGARETLHLLRLSAFYALPGAIAALHDPALGIGARARLQLQHLPGELHVRMRRAIALEKVAEDAPHLQRRGLRVGIHADVDARDVGNELGLMRPASLHGADRALRQDLTGL